MSATVPSTETAVPRERTERWFVHRGVPHFIKGYSATGDVFTRALPFLTFVFLLSAVNSIDLNWPIGGMILATLGGLALLLASMVGLNRLRGRPLFALPDRVGWLKLGLFMAVPSMLPLLFGGDLIGAGITFLTLAVVVAIAFVFTSYGIISITIWALWRLLQTLWQTFSIFTRTLPLLLLGFMFLFINAEAWQSAGRVTLAILWTVAISFSGLAALFVITQIPRELRGQGDFDTWSAVKRNAAEAPVPVPVSDPNGSPQPPPMTRPEYGNLFLVVFVTQSFRLILVSSLVALFFAALGVLIIQEETIEQWIGQPAVPAIPALPSFTLFGAELVLSQQLLQVAVSLGAFAGLYFSVYTTTDQGLRSEYFEDAIAEVRQNLAARALYRAVLDGPAEAGEPPGSNPRCKIANVAAWTPIFAAWPPDLAWPPQLSRSRGWSRRSPDRHWVF